jgi:hypothetical protein
VSSDYNALTNKPALTSTTTQTVVPQQLVVANPTDATKNVTIHNVINTNATTGSATGDLNIRAFGGGRLTLSASNLQLNAISVNADNTVVQRATTFNESVTVTGTQTVTGVTRANGGLIAAVPTTIAQSPWTAPTFQNNYNNTAGSSDAKAGYMKDSMGFVHLQGLITCTSASSVTAFTLPVGFRSTAARLFVGGSNATAVIPGQYWNIRIAQQTGNVELTTAANGFVDIGVVTFLADA